MTDHYGNERFLELLVQHLCADVNARQPATVTWVTVVPTNRILQPTNLLEKHKDDKIMRNLPFRLTAFV